MVTFSSLKNRQPIFVFVLALVLVVFSNSAHAAKDLVIRVYTDGAVSTTGGTASPAPGTHSVGNFAVVTVNVTVNAGYYIDGAKLTQGSTSTLLTASTSYVVDMGNRNSTLEIYIKKKLQYQVSVSYGPNGAITPGTSYVDANGNITFTITPEAGYVIASVIVDGEPVIIDGQPPKSYTFANVTLNHTIHATFSAVSSYKITATAGSGGTISPAGEISVPNLGSATFTITAEIGYKILDVKVDGTSISIPSGATTLIHTISNINENHTIDASFVGAYTITATNGAGGKISPKGSVPVNSGESKTFVFTPDPGNVVDQVVVNGTAVTDPGTTYTFTNITGNQTINVTFKFGGSLINDYTIVPAFVKKDIKPNVLLMLDNSASMYDLYYTTPDKVCYDESYDNTQTYYGYFDPATTYGYNLTTNKFYPGATIPNQADCSFGGLGSGNPYFCVKMGAGTVGSRKVTAFIATGKFLNWLSMSKIDMQKLTLTGGKYDTFNDMLVGESRGCMGRRFIRRAPGITAMTFAVRGPHFYGDANTFQSTLGGETRIEIFDATYNKEDCEDAVEAWEAGSSLGTIQVPTRSCIGTGTNADRTDTYNHIIHNCYWYYNNKGLSNLNTLQGDCEKLYSSLYGNDPSRIISGTAADAVCSSALRHPLYSDTDDGKGFMGKCWSYSGGKGTWDSTCAETEVKHYCEGIKDYGVADPSVPAAGDLNRPVPAFVMDAGTNALGNPAGTFFVHVGLAVPPQGILERFKDRLNFGTMFFHLDGSGSECNNIKNADGSYTISCAKYCRDLSTGDLDRECAKDADCPSGYRCLTIPPTDGGKIRSYITEANTVGDHDSGLVREVDIMEATSWTPYGEAMYNAIGYFANKGSIRLAEGDFDLANPPSLYRCQTNHVILISDGMSTADRNDNVTTLANIAGTTESCDYGGSTSLALLAKLAWQKNIFQIDPSKSWADLAAAVYDNEKIQTHVLFTGKNEGTGNCNAKTFMTSVAVSGGSSKLYEAGGSNYPLFKESLESILNEISLQASSGTAASILSNSEGSGANMLQAVFYPNKTFDASSANPMIAKWVGEMQNLWYYVDPFISNSTVRDDIIEDGKHKLYLKQNNVVQFFFDGSNTKVRLLRDEDGDGIADATQPTGFPKIISPDELQSIWRAGRLLWNRDLSTNPRKLYTYLSGTSLTTFVDTNASSLYTSLNVASDEAAGLISYIHGVDDTSMRPRKLKIDGVVKEWKLGDIISSTPRIQSNTRLNAYSLEKGTGYEDGTYAAFISSSPYQNRGMAYVGANDGMLHAFKLGQLDVKGYGDLKATLTGTGLGQEMWGYIPKNALPYLKYFADPAYNHLYYVDGTPTLVDVSTGRPAGCDAGIPYWNCTKSSDGGTWRTLLIGGMGIGGACRNTGHACSTNTDCVQTPLNGVGYSSYFNLDVTDQYFESDGTLYQEFPKFVWEFNDPDNLGFATSGPAIVRVNALDTSKTPPVPDKNKNGRWFAVFGSGPTGPIDRKYHQFMATSDQTLKLFVVDLNATAPLEKDTDYWVLDTGIPNAFAGSITNGVIDTDRHDGKIRGNYQDDSIYVGYTKRAGAGTVDDPYRWTDGGVLRLVIRETYNPDDAPVFGPPTDTNATWVFSKVIDGIGPVTTNIAKLQDRKRSNLWLYFGTGRYYYSQDDKDTQRMIIGLKDPCYKAEVKDADDNVIGKNDIDGACDTELTLSRLKDTDGTFGGSDGWFVKLSEKIDNANPTLAFGAERVVTDPVALVTGVVFFTTFMPTADPCSYGGNSYLWALDYDTGLSPDANVLQGKALIQISTGEFKEIDLSTAFDKTNANSRGGRRITTPMTGKPPGDPPPIVSKAGLKPVKKVLHVQER